MTPQPQPLRCETCDHYVDSVRRIGYKKCKLSNHLVDSDCRINEHIQIVGCASHSSRPAPDVLEELHGVVKQLYDDGFRNPLVTVECAIAYMKDPTVPGHPEKQKRQRGDR